jgi:hypothetical protein
MTSSVNRHPYCVVQFRCTDVNVHILQHTIILKIKVLMKDACIFNAIQMVFHIGHSFSGITMLLDHVNLNALHTQSFTMSSVLGYI